MKADVRLGEDIDPVLQCAPVDPSGLARYMRGSKRKAFLFTPSPADSIVACDSCGIDVWIGPGQLAVCAQRPGALVRCYECLLRSHSIIHR